MGAQLEIRAERAGDEDAIRAVTAAAFATTSFSGGTEPAVIDALRQAGELALSLVAISGEDLVGQVTLSRVTIGAERDGWYGLGPIAVDPTHQRAGVGRALINAAMTWLEDNGAKGCALVGSPRYYARFGFTSSPEVTYAGVDTQYVLLRTFGSEKAQGVLLFCDAFEDAARFRGVMEGKQATE